MDKYLKKIIEGKTKRAKELREAIKAAETADEVRRLGDELTGVETELREAQEQLQNYEARNVQSNAQRSANGFNPAAAVATAQMNQAQKRNENEDPTESVEYRSAFMNLVLKNTPIPSELRVDASTTTTDAATVIPTNLVNQIIEKMDNVGMILPLVSRSSYAGGVTIPTSTAKPVATWVNEGASSDRQKKTTGSIAFTYHKLRCEISMSMEVGTMALSAFEAKFVENVSKAMIKAIEEAIINGNGTSQPKGILKETPETGQAIEVAADGTVDYKLLCDAEAAIPEEYEGTARWCMSKKTFMSFVGMTDSNGQPIARVNYGIGGRPERTLLGREVVLASTYMPNYTDTVENDTLFAFIFDFGDYLLNTIYDMGISKKQDWDTEDLLTKAVMSVDGKVIDKGSLVTLTKKKAGA